MWLWVWETLRVSWTIRCKKGVPRDTTLNAEFKVHINDCHSLRIVDFQHLKEARAAWIRFTLSGGSLASIFTESRIMPMNSKTLSGPWVLLVATWIPRFLNARSMDPLDSIRQHIDEKGTTSNILSWSTRQGWTGKITRRRMCVKKMTYWLAKCARRWCLHVSEKLPLRETAQIVCHTVWYILFVTLT